MFKSLEVAYMSSKNNKSNVDDRFILRHSQLWNDTEKSNRDAINAIIQSKGKNNKQKASDK